MATRVKVLEPAEGVLDQTAVLLEIPIVDALLLARDPARDDWDGTPAAATTTREVNTGRGGAYANLSGHQRSVDRELRGEGPSIRGAGLAAGDVGGQVGVLVQEP